MMNARRSLVVLLSCVVVLWTACGGGGSSSQTPGQPNNGGVTVATGSHLLGSATARVTIVEFSDFQCPYCKQFYTDTEGQIIADYVNTGKARFAYRQFPLSGLHVNAQIAAEASECAAKLGGNDAFWSYHNLLFTNGSGDGTGLGATSLKQYASDLHLDAAAFGSCLDSHEMAATVSRDISDGSGAGVQGTPTFFINGKVLRGAQPYSAFKTMIDAEL